MSGLNCCAIANLALGQESLEIPDLDRATACKCCVRINSRCTSGSFRSTKSLTVTKGAEVQSMPSLAQINLKKACMTHELCYVKQHLWRYEYEYKRNRYTLVTTAVAVKQLHVIS